MLAGLSYLESHSTALTQKSVAVAITVTTHSIASTCFGQCPFLGFVHSSNFPGMTRFNAYLLMPDCINQR